MINRKLKQWLSDQKGRARAGQLSADKVAFLETFTDFSKTRKSVGEWVEFAERRIKDGALPPLNRFCRPGTYGLVEAIHKYPSKFSHIKVLKGNRTRKDNLVLAALLQKKYGKVPHDSWLHKNGFGGLAQSMTKFPDKYRHVAQENKNPGVSISQHQATIRKLVAAHDGMFPNTAWLIKHGYHSLYKIIRIQPELVNQFKRKNGNVERHLQQRKTIYKKNVCIVKKYSKKRAKWWVEKHNGLFQFVKNHSTMFPVSRFPRTWGLPK